MIGNRKISSIVVALMLVFMASTVYLLANQMECELTGVIPEDDLVGKDLQLLTDKKIYESGESVTFILHNNGTEDVGYDSSLRETMQIFDQSGKIVVMMPYLQTFGIIAIGPGDDLRWSWNQSHYLYAYSDIRDTSPTWDYRSWTQVHTGFYTARITFGDFQEEVEFHIEPTYVPFRTEEHNSPFNSKQNASRSLYYNVIHYPLGARG
jgi:hypothetical protein